MGDRPNVLLITTDQQRFDTIHAAGNPHIRTPNLNWLADNGIRCSNAYTDCPVCVPARATIMTGKHGHSMGLVTNGGKMHFNPRRCNHGFEHMEILEDYYRHMAAHPEKGVPMNHGLGQNVMEPGVSTVDETASLTHWTVDRSIDFLETRDDTRPFFLWTSFAKPHPPLDPCRNYWEMYRDRPVPAPVRGDWSAMLDDVPPGFLASSFHLNMCHRFSDDLIADIRRAYYACITQIDYNLGMLFARLRELDLLENTWIMFTSDHGEMLGDHRMGAKSVGMEGSAHIPMLVKPPGGHGSADDRLRGLLVERLAAAGSDAVRDGKLVCRNPGLGLEDLLKNTWPGYHTCKVPADVLH